MRLDMISRRRFLKSAGVAALAVAAAGVLAGCDGGSNSGSGNVTPAPVPGATEDVNIIFFDDETSEIIGEGILKNVLKTADHVNTNDIPEDQFPEGYHVAKPKDLEIRIKDDKKYIYVFVTDVTYTDISKKVEITLRDMSNYGAVIKTTATVNKDATTVMPKEIELPEGYEAHVVPRSSTFKNYGLLQANSMGVVDYTYRGDNDQWRVPMYATRDVHIDKNTRISQFRIMKNQPPLVFTRVEHLTGPDRGGFGSTGK